MIRTGLKKVIALLYRVALRLVSAWWKRTLTAWRREIANWKRTKKPPSQRHWTGFVMLVFMLPAMWYVSLNTGWMTLLSFSFSAFLAVSYSTFFSKPHIFAFIFIGILLGEVPMEILFDAKDSAFTGELTAALIMLTVAAYIMWMSREMKAGNVPEQSTHSRVSSKRRRTRSLK